MASYRPVIPHRRDGWGTICLDPPWALNTSGVRRRLHYDRMNLAEIAALPLSDVLADHGHLWLWTTNPHLPEALSLLPGWGVEYRSLLTWCKPRMGLGWWLRSRTEHLIFATRDKTTRANPGNVTTVLHAAQGKHSEKPAAAYELIARLSPAPRLELFARTQRDGWTCVVSDAAPVYPRDG